MKSNPDIVSKILNLENEFSEPDWDGYGAKPVSDTSIESSVSLVESLGDFKSIPDVGVDPDGYVTLEWYEDRDKQCLVTVSDDGNAFVNAISGNGMTFSRTFCISDESPLEMVSVLEGFHILKKRKSQ